MQIYVLSAAAKQFTLEIENSSSTIENVKNVIKNREEGKEVPMDELDLVFRGTILEEGRTVSYYNIQDGSTLNMAFQLRGEQVQVILEEEEWRSYRLEIGESDTLDDLKKKIEDLSGISPDWEEQEFEGTCLKEGVILDQMRLIQSKILESYDSAPSCLTIISRYPLRRTESQLRHMEYQLPSLIGETVEVIVEDEVKGWTWRIKIGESDKLHVLKKMIKKIIGKYPDWDTHNFNGEHLKEEGVILDQMRLIQSKVLESGDQRRIDAMYDLNGRPTIMMYKLWADGSSSPPKNGKGGIESMQIYVVSAAAKQFTLEIENSRIKIENVKNVIKNKEEGKEIPMDELDLVFQGTILEEGKTLSYYNIQHGSTLNMAFDLSEETVQVFLQDEALGTTETIKIRESDTLDDLKVMIKVINPDWVHWYRLDFIGTCLKEGVILDQMRLIQSEVLESGDQNRIAGMYKHNGRPTILMCQDCCMGNIVADGSSSPPKRSSPAIKIDDASDDNVIDSNDASDDNDDASDDNVMDSNDAGDDNDDASDDNVMDSNDASDDNDDNVMDSNDASDDNGKGGIESMQIIVFNASHWIPLEIENSSSTIGNIKNVIKNKEAGKELPMDELDLVFQGTILEEGKTLSYYNIQHGSTLNMAFQLRGERVQVILKREELRTYRMEIGESDTLDDLKKKIEDLGGISPGWKKLEFNSTCLKEGVILDQMRLIQSKVLKSGDQKRISRMYSDSGRPTIISEFPSIRMEYHLQPLIGETVQVIVQDEGIGWTWRIEIGESDTLDDLKKKIVDVIGIYPDWDTHMFNGEHLKTEGVILDQMILIQRKVLERIHAIYEHNAGMYKDNGRRKVLERIHAIYEEQNAGMYKDNGRCPTIIVYKFLQMGNFVHHSPKWAADGSMQIYVLGAAAKQQWITLEIENSSSRIENVKNVIKNRGEKELRMDELDLVFEGTILEEGKTLSYYNIQHGSTLNMAFQLRGETVQVILKDGPVVTTWTIEIGESDTLDDLKKKIKDLSGISPYQNMLDFNGTSLKEGVILDQMRLIQSEVLESGDQNRIAGMYKHNGRPTILGNIVADGSRSPPKNDDANDDNEVDKEVANSLKGDDWDRLTWIIFFWFICFMIFCVLVLMVNV